MQKNIYFNKPFEIFFEKHIVFKRIILVSSLIILCNNLYAQNCGNIGFEDGTFNGWILSNGDLTESNSKPYYGTEISGTVNDEHLITTGGYDPKVTREPIPQVAPGSLYSVRLGFTERGGRYDRLKKTFLVTSDNSLFQFRFAVVLQQDVNHVDYQKPGFSIKIYNQSSEVLGCSTYDVQLQRNSVVNGFKSQTSTAYGELHYRNWTTGAMDLREYIGQNLTIEVEVHGCTRRAHFGYAYFDAQCLKTEITPQSNCPDANGFITLKAPDGFETYKWSNGTFGPTTKVKATLGDKVFVKVLPFLSLNNTCEFQLDYVIKNYKVNAVVNKTICEGDAYLIENTKYTKAGTYTQTISKSTVCDSIVTLNLKVNTPVRFSQTKTICDGDSIKVGNNFYKTEGIHITSIPRPQIDENPVCDSIITTDLIIERNFFVELQPIYEIKKEQHVQLNTSVNPPGIYKYEWTPKDSLSCSDCPSPIVKPAYTKSYTLKVSNENSRCPVIKSTRIFVLTNWILTPNIFTPNDDQNNDIFFVWGDKSVKQIKEFQVFNRWGMLLFQLNDFNHSDPLFGWNGTFQGKSVQSDTYVYKVKAELDTGEIKDFLGAVLLMR